MDVPGIEPGFPLENPSYPKKSVQESAPGIEPGLPLENQKLSDRKSAYSQPFYPIGTRENRKTMSSIEAKNTKTKC